MFTVGQKNQNGSKQYLPQALRLGVGKPQTLSSTHHFQLSLGCHNCSSALGGRQSPASLQCCRTFISSDELKQSNTYAVVWPYSPSSLCFFRTWTLHEARQSSFSVKPIETRAANFISTSRPQLIYISLCYLSFVFPTAVIHV